MFVADGIGEWLWKGPRAQDSFALEASVEYRQGRMARHLLTITSLHGRPAVKDERIEPAVALPDNEGLSYRRSYEDTWPASERGRFAIDLRKSSDAAAGENLILFDFGFQPESSLVSFASPAEHGLQLSRGWRQGIAFSRRTG